MVAVGRIAANKLIAFGRLSAPPEALASVTLYRLGELIIIRRQLLAVYGRLQTPTKGDSCPRTDQKTCDSTGPA